MASVKWTNDALRDIRGIDAVIVRRVVAKVGWLADNFSDITPEALHRELRKLYKLRIGDYRVTYSLHSDLIIIQAVGHRSDIYK